MAATTAEHLRKGDPVISDQEALSYVGRFIPFNRAVQAYLGYRTEIVHTHCLDEKQRLEVLLKQSRAALVEFLGSKRAVNEAIILWQESQPNK